MTLRFTAQVACGLDDEDEDDCAMAGVAESDEGEAFSLFFMCDFEGPDAQEVSLGFDTHGLVTPGQGTAYGCVREATLDGDVLRVLLDPAALPALELEATERHPIPRPGRELAIVEYASPPVAAVVADAGADPADDRTMGVDHRAVPGLHVQVD
jgi:hypothetical protein